MSFDPETTRTVRSWLDEGVTELPDRVLDAVLDEVPAIPQRRATWWPARRLSDMNTTLKFGIAAVVLVAAALFGINYLGSANVGGPGGPTPSPDPTAAAEPTATPEPAGGLPDGPHLMVDDPSTGASITVTISAADWHGEPGQGFLTWGPTGADGPTGAGMIGFTEGEYYVYGDPCEWWTTRPETPATTVDVLMLHLASQAIREISTVEDVTVDGHAGKQIIVEMGDEVADFDACDKDGGDPTFGLFGVPPNPEVPSRYSQDVGQIEEVWAVDVDGTLVVLIGAYYADTPQHAIDEMRAMLASASIELP